jgi:hypothetical protein
MHINQLCLADRIRVERILKYQEQIYFRYLIENKNMSLNIIQYLRKNGFDDILSGQLLSYSPHITFKYFKENSFLDWEQASLAHSMLQANPSEMDVHRVLYQTHLPLQWYFVNHCNTLTLDHVLTHNNNDWNWHMLSASIPFDVIKNNPELPWDTNTMSSNSTLDLEYVLANPDKEWLYDIICMYNRSVESILENASFWAAKRNANDVFHDVWWYLSQNKHLTIEMIHLCPSKMETIFVTLL